MKFLAIRLLQASDGQDLIEYGLLLGIITLAALLAVASIGDKVMAYFAGLNTALP